MTIMFPPLTFSFVTYMLFPRMSWTFVQLYWVITMVWLGINYITITIEKAIEKNKGGR